ncbi:FecR family protein [Pseudobacter ginsenosidimutans]|uniref:FecR family protein n=1 Tax=Pseudobacter ginsenosidimutans TaxID=661488 RepID=A0A4Q7N6A3_9BACT|nr:FecR family protein [Pseudobacter ginsenosidimutans]QEC45107.1 DUF4974 domain-containing protein [Pseudobacter ginsenosidimutans]RZS76603.1 FecR family protein [Pseudobacter ginsenosidimutans]
MTPIRFTELFGKFLQGELSPPEEKELWEAWQSESTELSVVKEQLVGEAFDHLPVSYPPTEQQVQDIYERVIEEAEADQETGNKKTAFIYQLSRRWWAAAVIALLLGVAVFGYLLNRGNKNPGSKDIAQQTNERLPGKQGAILTLADQSQVLLDTVKDGAVLALPGGGRARVENGNLVYDAKGVAVTFNTIATPKGRQYRVTLPDGTIIWLNSGSSVRYPTLFAGNERVVHITGEAYLEVAKNSKMPFRVDLENNTTIEVLGTSFNVNAYDEEPSVNTTLLEGAVRVNKKGQAQKLLPGQQAQVSGTEKIRVVDVDVEQVVAWKNGLFDFNNKDVKTVLREIARWYDLDLVYESEPAAGEIAGKMQRNLALSQVMETLSDLDIHYRIEGRKLIVSK